VHSEEELRVFDGLNLNERLADPTLEELQQWVDAPIRLKTDIIRSLYGDAEAEAETKAHVKRSKRARYHNFPDIRKLFLLALEDGLSPKASLTTLRDAVIITLRITTMARDFDLAEVLPAVYSDGHRRYLKYTAKGSTGRTTSITGDVLHIVQKYILAAEAYKGQRLIQYADGSHRALSRDRIAALARERMTAAGIDTTVYKPHCLRGAAATMAAILGVPADLIQGRAGWADAKTMARHYQAAHQALDWSLLFKEKTVRFVEMDVNADHEETEYVGRHTRKRSASTSDSDGSKPLRKALRAARDNDSGVGSGDEDSDIGDGDGDGAEQPGAGKPRKLVAFTGVFHPVKRSGLTPSSSEGAEAGTRTREKNPSEPDPAAPSSTASPSPRVHPHEESAAKSKRRCPYLDAPLAPTCAGCGAPVRREQLCALRDGKWAHSRCVQRQFEE
jgi:integrase